MRPLESFSREVATEKPEPLAVEAKPPAPDEGLVIEEVAMKGFMRYLRPTKPPLTFPEKFTAITGPTGAGKTTILDAITFALYKRSTRTDLRTIKIAEVVQRGGHVRLGFRQGGARYDVRRGIASTGQSYLEVRRDGKPLRGTIPEVEILIQDIVGLDYDGFRNSTFVRQEEMKQLGAESPSKRLEVFQKLFRLETFEKAAEVSKERLDGVQARIEGAEGEARVLRDQVQQLPERQDEVRLLEDAIVGHGTDLEEAEKRLTGLQKDLKRREARHEAYIQARTTRDEHRGALEDLNRRLEEMGLAQAGLPELREQAAALEREVEELRTQEDEVKALLDKQHRFTLLATEVQAARARLGDEEAHVRGTETELEGKVEEAETRLAALSTKMGAEEAFGALRREGSLDERVRRIDKELEWLAERRDLVRQLEREQRESREALEAVRSDVEGITRDTFLVSEIQETIEALRAELEEKRADGGRRRDERQTSLKELEAKRDAVGFGPPEEERLEELQGRVAHRKDAESTLRHARKELQKLGGLEGQLREMEEQKKALRESLQKEEKALGELEEEEVSYQKARGRVTTLQDERDEAAQVLFRAEADRKAARKRVAELEGLAAKLKAVEGGLEELRGRAEVHAVLKDGIFHRKGVVMFAVNRLLPELEIETARNLDDLTDGRLRRVRLETHEEPGGYGIRILVEGVDGEWHDVGVFSGGERTQINAALRFAIAKELASMPQVGRTYGRMKTLFIDEGDLGSLDTERSRELFVAKLFKMGAFFEKVILITHLTEVAERFPGRVRVTMTPEGESRAEVVA